MRPFKRRIMHLTGESGKERTSSGVSARCAGTIAFAHSPGDLRQRAHLMQFPIVFVAHGDVEVAVAGDYLGDMRWQPAHDRVGDEQPSEIMGCESQWLTGCWVGQAGADQCGGENVANDVRADPAALGAE